MSTIVAIVAISILAVAITYVIAPQWTLAVATIMPGTPP